MRLVVVSREYGDPIEIREEGSRRLIAKVGFDVPIADRVRVAQTIALSWNELLGAARMAVKGFDIDGPASAAATVTTGLRGAIEAIDAAAARPVALRGRR